MLHRYRLRAAVGAVGAALMVAALAAGPAALAAPAGLAGSAPGGSAPAIGGTLLSGHGVIVDYGQDSAGRLPDVEASAFVIADAGTGQVLAAKDPHGWYRPASTLKVLTAISLIPLLNPDSTVVATKLAASATPNVAGVLAGHAYKISDLFTALLTISANDAAIALAQATGSLSEGMADINAEARHLQADDTVAIQPNGLDAPGQRTSAYDLALIARQALRMPAFLSYDETLSAKFPVTAKKSVTLYNQDSLLTTYPGAIGGKIGWTSAAGATYIGMAKRNGVTLIVTLLHCPALTEIDSAEKLLDWGFAEDGKVAPVGTLVSALASPAAVPAGAVPAGGASAGGASAGGASAGGASAGAVPSVGVRSGASAYRGRAAAPGRGHPAAAGPSVLTAAGFSCVAVVTVGLGLASTRRQRPSARYPGNRVNPGLAPGNRVNPRA
jgi:serine-type D-Ala-D-Ala carboxypeptidase (penicillin-binding protein 5/6)